jgi:hypothetical protein
MQLPIHNQMFFQALTDSKLSLLLSELPRTSSRTELNSSTKPLLIPRHSIETMNPKDKAPKKLRNNLAANSTDPDSQSLGT